jgi:hypothetical protein
LFLDFSFNNTNGTNHYCPTLQKKCTNIKNKCQGKITDGIVLLHDTAYPHCDSKNAGPTECHVMEGAQTLYIQPEITMLQFSNLWIITDSRLRPYTYI